MKCKAFKRSFFMEIKKPDADLRQALKVAGARLELATFGL